MSIAEQIRDKLKQHLAPQSLRVTDESHRHVGHVGARPDGETHFHVDIVSDVFVGRTRLDRHRLVQDILAEELAGPVHALSLRLRTLTEAAGDPAGR